MPVLKDILDEKAIAALVDKLAVQISADYARCDLIVMGVLNGAFVFLADLVRKLDLSITIDFVQLSSYGTSMRNSSKIVLVKKPGLDFAGKHVLVVEDIVDTGLTLRYLKQYLLDNRVGTVKTCVFADKKACRETTFEADYVGYTARDSFLVGYGLDYAGHYRQLPKLYELLLDE